MNSIELGMIRSFGQTVNSKQCLQEVLHEAIVGIHEALQEELTAGEKARAELIKTHGNTAGNNHGGLLSALGSLVREQDYSFLNGFVDFLSGHYRTKTGS